MFRRLIVALALLCLPSLASAVTYNGELFENGLPVNGMRYFVLTVYDASTGGTVLHTQADSLAVVGGVFHAKLTAPDATWYQTGRWAGVSVNGGTELSPRMEIDYLLRPSQILVVRPPTIASAVPSTWTQVDSLSFTAPVNGVVTLNVTGYGLWNGGPGSGTPSGASAIFSISESTPSVAMTLMRTYSGGDGFSVTAMLPVTAGPHTYYFWARTLAPGTTFEVDTGLYQAHFKPN